MAGAGGYLRVYYLQVLCSIDTDAAGITLIDSLTPNRDFSERLVLEVRRWVAAELDRTKHLMTPVTYAKLQSSPWAAEVNPMCAGHPPPHQRHIVDCGVYCVQNLRRLAAGQPLIFWKTAARSECFHLRQLMVLELAAGRLIRDDMINCTTQVPCRDAYNNSSFSL